MGEGVKERNAVVRENPRRRRRWLSSTAPANRSARAAASASATASEPAGSERGDVDGGGDEECGVTLVA